MPRMRVKKTSRGEIPLTIFEAACKTVVETGDSIRKVAKAFNLCHVTLHRCLKRYRAEGGELKTVGYQPHNKVFTAEQEKILVNYCRDCIELYNGLTTRDLRTLAYQYASANNCSYPNKWDECELAGEDWLHAFLKRNPSVVVQQSIKRTSKTSSTTKQKQKYNKQDQIVSKLPEKILLDKVKHKKSIFLRSKTLAIPI